MDLIDPRHSESRNRREGGIRVHKLIRWSPLALLALLPFVLAAVPRPGSAPRPAVAAQEGGTVGMDTCAACHEETVTAFQESIHGKKGFEMRSSRACETCHGPGKAHVDAEGGKGTIINPDNEAKDAQSAICLECHERGTQMLWHGSTHDTHGLSCLNCHSIHHAKDEKILLKTTTETEQCFTCHKQKQSQFYRASHHPIPEGKMECTSCHNPHGTQSDKLIAADSVTEQCYKCHTEKRGPFLWDHIPVREDCLNCHDPHGTNHLRMLRAKEPFLCQRCHSDTRHPGTLYDQTAVNTFSNRIMFRGCSNCHQNIHGSNHPSGKYFLR
jgi:DmsE family decaheme c-type cytochrome